MNRGAINLGLVAMEVCWLTPWVVLVGLWTDASQPRQLLSPASILALVLLGSLSTQVLGRNAATNRATRFALVGLGVMVTLVAVRLDQYSTTAGLDWLALLVAAVAGMLGQVSLPALAFGLGLFLWWRGIRLGIQSASYSDVETAFRWGIGLGIPRSPAEKPRRGRVCCQSSRDGRHRSWSASSFSACLRWRSAGWRACALARVRWPSIRSGLACSCSWPERSCWSRYLSDSCCHSTCS